MFSINIQKVHCFFEQSGTFKNEFLKLGVGAEDYDICNDFGKTDHVIDLFSEIENGYCGLPSIFDNITSDDLVFAFFPCVRFESQILLHFRGQCFGMDSWNIQKKMRHCITLMSELSDMYALVNKLCIICIDRGIRLIMENPYSEEHFLKRYWCLRPGVVDKDRRDRGDYFKKPTQYWFINCEPQNNLILEPINYNAIDCYDAIRSMKKESYILTGAKNRKVARSMIHPDYANRFIKEFILGGIENEN